MPRKARKQIGAHFAPRAAGICALILALAWGCAERRDGGAAMRPTVGQRRPPAPLASPIRAVWVARFHYRNPADIAEIMRNCASAGFNTVLFQVRGDATVSYPSRIEPWSGEYGHTDPGFDPLAVAVAEAHRNGLRIEAWVNVMPAWFGKQPPRPAAHVLNSRPEWLLYDDSGRRQPLNEHYVILNPANADARRHIVAVFHEIMSRYDVDGLHLDYVRYVWDVLPGARERYPRDPATLATYRRQTGMRPEDDRAAWAHWRANQITRLVEEIRNMVRSTRPGATLTAATWGDPSDGYNEYLQNATGWLAAGLIDVAFPMAYREDAARFVSDVQQYRSAAPGRRVAPGIGLYKLTRPEQVRAQLERSMAWGGDFAIFSYESLFATYRERARGGAAPKEAGLRRMRLEVMAGVLGGRQ